uniref:Vitellogenin receptor n=1 Tax=Blattella germanica TaxID=6973 RepID=Q2YI44_BLAGE|nr:vitellogenin receptor [Blattella germanica]
MGQLMQAIVIWLGLLTCCINVEVNGYCQGQGTFECHNGACISETKHCDGHVDCTDGSDEVDCNQVFCKEPDWFRCRNGRCISSGMRCDDDDDCGDWSDEDDCHIEHVPKNCTDSEWRCMDNNCIIIDWVCDGRQDCMDGSDELQGCSTVLSCHDGFMCKNGHCLPITFHCDGSDDCGDNSDEDYCPSVHYIPPENCTTDKNLHLCHDGRTCISLNELCDEVQHCPDHSDEGPGCNNSKITCRTAWCNHRCIPTPQGPQCVCQTGYTMAVNNTCVDIDECLEYGICDQKCLNMPGKYDCYCDEGYELAEDKRTCRATGADPLLVFASTDEIRGFYIKKDFYFVIASKLERAVGISYDRGHVYWTDLMFGEEAIVRSSEDGSHVETLVTAGLYEPEDLMVDWVTENIYFTDAEAKHIGVCSNNGSMCTVLVNEDIDKPRAIALLPTEGLMFWSDWGKKIIARAGMDGSKPEAFISTNLHYANGLTIDIHNDRLYWVDAKYLVIESCKLDGTDRRIILQNEVKHPYSIAVFEDTLYWSDWQGHGIQACNKFTGKNHRVVVREKSKKKFIYGIHVYHPAMISVMQNPCKKADCSDLCLLAPNRTYTCACPEHKVRGADMHSCHESLKQEVMIGAANNKLYAVGHQFLGKQTFYEMSLQAVNHIGAITYNSLTGHLVIFDAVQHKLFNLGLKTMKLSQLASDVGYIDGMDFDYLGNNIYLCDGQKATIEILSLTTLERPVLLHSFEGEVPLDIAVVPEEGIMFIAMSRHLTSSENGPHIDRMTMDGREHFHIVESGLDGPIISLHYDKELHRVFWTDPNEGQIGSAAANGMDQHIYKHSINNPSDVASLGRDLFWTDWGQPYIYWANKFDGESRMKRLMLDVPKSQKLKLQGVRGIRAKPNHPCQKENGGCSHICALSQKRMVCLCPMGMQLKKNEKTCFQPVVCSEDKFKCKSDNLCIPRNFRCNGRKDCQSGEDELDCEAKKCLDSQFTCKNGQCISIEKLCNGERDCLDGSDEKNCEKCEEAIQFKCSSGECVDIHDRCDHYPDCTDGSDESNCENVSCPPTDFKCHIGVCVPKYWVCDGEPDCIDGTDELNCAPITCGPDLFSCNNGRCVDKKLVCNHNDDCGDSSDEITCKHASSVVCQTTEITCTSHNKSVISCVPMSARCNDIPDCPLGDDERGCEKCMDFQFKCNDGRCIPFEWTCDGTKDCADGSDENQMHCHSQSVETGTPGPCTEYSCDNGACVSLSLVCNGRQDCSDSSDEGGFCGSSCKEGYPCQQVCMKTPRGPQCGCSKGFKLLNNGAKCQDINECESQVCAQVCHNTPGSFSCICDAGFELRSDRISCKAIGKAKEFIFVADKQIRRVTHELRFMKIAYLDYDFKVTGLDVDSKLGMVYWSSDETNTIYRMSLIGGTKAYLTGIGSPTDIALDWITQNVYYVDKDTIQSIKVCNLDSQQHATVVHVDSGYSASRIAVDPFAGFIFWIEISTWNIEIPKSILIRADMSGENRKTLVNEHMMLVYGIALDVVRKRIFIADEHQNTIESMGYSGEDRHVVVDSNEHVQKPINLALFEGTLYWLTSGTGQLTSYKLYGPPERPFDKHQLYSYGTEHFAILQASMQPIIVNPCANHTCDEMCVLSPSGYPVCLCSDGTIVEMGKSCPKEELHDGSRSSHGLDSSKESGGTQAAGKSSAGLVMGLIIIAVIIATLLGAYYYKYRGKKNSKFGFSMHFQNPTFGVRNSTENPSTPPQGLVPGQHQYTNPFDSSGVLEHPDGKVLILSQQEKPPVIIRIPSQSSERTDAADFEMEDDTSQEFVSDNNDMKAPLIS